MKKIIILISVTFFLVLVGVGICSQEPPTPRIDGQNYQGASAKTDKSGNTNENRTQKEPLFLKPTVSKESNPDTDKQRKDIDQKSPAKDIMDIISIALTAIATVAIAIFTFLLFVYNRKMWETTAQSIELSRQEFIASHPPKLRVNSVRLRFYSETAKPWKIQCVITNIGGTSTTIKESNLTFDKLNKIENQLPVVLPFGDQEHMLSEAAIAPGEYIIGELILNEQIRTALDIDMWQGTRRDNETPLFYFFGYIDYLDDAGINRKTAFCRGYNVEQYRFTAVQDDDYEYSY